MEKLSVAGLVESDSQRQVDAHDPVLGSAWEDALQDVDDETQNEIDMQSRDCAEGERNVSDPEVGQLPIAK